MLDHVKHGRSYGILYGKKKKPIAMIVPFKEEGGKAKRKIGLYDGKVTVTFSKNFEITEEELVELQ